MVHIFHRCLLLGIVGIALCLGDNLSDPAAGSSDVPEGWIPFGMPLDRDTSMVPLELELTGRNRFIRTVSDWLVTLGAKKVRPSNDRTKIAFQMTATQAESTFSIFLSTFQNEASGVITIGTLDDCIIPAQVRAYVARARVSNFPATKWTRLPQVMKKMEEMPSRSTEPGSFPWQALAGLTSVFSLVLGAMRFRHSFTSAIVPSEAPQLSNGPIVADAIAKNVEVPPKATRKQEKVQKARRPEPTPLASSQKQARSPEKQAAPVNAPCCRSLECASPCPKEVLPEEGCEAIECSNEASSCTESPPRRPCGEEESKGQASAATVLQEPPKDSKATRPLEKPLPQEKLSSPERLSSTSSINVPAPVPAPVHSEQKPERACPVEALQVESKSEEIKVITPQSVQQSQETTKKKEKKTVQAADSAQKVARAKRVPSHGANKRDGMSNLPKSVGSALPKTIPLKEKVRSASAKPTIMERAPTPKVAEEAKHVEGTACASLPPDSSAAEDASVCGSTCGAESEKAGDGEFDACSVDYACSEADSQSSSMKVDKSEFRPRRDSVSLPRCSSTLSSALSQKSWFDMMEEEEEENQSEWAGTEGSMELFGSEMIGSDHDTQSISETTSNMRDDGALTLEHAWALWTNEGTPGGAAVTRLGSFDTMDDFRSLWQRLSSLSNGTTLYLLRQDVTPKAMEVMGGARWVASQLPVHQRDSLWCHMVVAVVLGHYCEPNMNELITAVTLTAGWEGDRAEVCVSAGRDFHQGHGGPMSQKAGYDSVFNLHEILFPSDVPLQFVFQSYTPRSRFRSARTSPHFRDGQGIAHRCWDPQSQGGRYSMPHDPTLPPVAVVPPPYPCPSVEHVKPKMPDADVPPAGLPARQSSYVHNPYACSGPYGSDGASMGGNDMVMTPPEWYQPYYPPSAAFHDPAIISSFPALLHS